MAGRVGSEVTAQCRRCGETWHVVIALADGAIAQVECSECRARHRYRPGGGGSARRAAAPRSPRAARVVPKAVVEADPSRPVRAFSPKDTYQVGDRVVHPSFGEGVVQATLGPTKVEVLFGVGSKRLVQGRG